MHLKSCSLAIAFALFLPGAAFAQDSGLADPAPSTRVVGAATSAPLDADARALIEGTNAFSLELLHAVSQREQNLIVSPASVSAAMGFAYRGAAGETALQLQHVMHYPFDPVRNLKASGAILDTMSFAGTGRELRTANALWLQEGMPFDAQFERDMATYAKAGFERTDFRSDPEAARQRINGWVADATRANIRELLKDGVISGDTRAVLVNAMWFKADWRAPFDKDATRMEPFTAVDGAKTSQPLMHQSGNFRALKRNGVSAIQLPYKGGEVALVAFLPDRYDALPRFAKKLTAEDLAKWFADLDNSAVRETVLTFPRFKLRWASELSGTLAKMGAPIAFTDDADFSGMARLPYPGGNPYEIGLKISHVIHEATIEVDETGSEASAATAVVMNIIVSGSRQGPPPPPPFIFRADKPFLFALRDLRTGLVLFMGQYVRPEQGQPTSAD